MGKVLPYIIAAYVLFGIFVAAMASWYYAALIRTIAGGTSIAGLRFANTTTGRGLVWLFLGNILIIVFTLGLGYPIILHRSMRFVANNLTCTGAIDPTVLRQSELVAPRTGEGLFQLLDSGGGVV